MKKKKRSHIKKVLLIILFLALGVLIVTLANALPKILYSQSSIQTENLTGAYDTMDTNGIFYNNQISSHSTNSTILANNVLGETTDNKRIEVDLTNQRLYAFEGDKKVYDFLVSTGKWGRTPTGTFRIWTKLRYTKMEGGNKALNTYYYLPNVPFTMFFANEEIPAWRGFGIHGTYWHNNFGTPMSHGCINMKTEEAEKIFYWAHPTLADKASIRATDDNQGTTVTIYGVAP